VSLIDIQIRINGENVNIRCEAHLSLLRVLRDNFYYDVKCGCEEGDCGTCTVILDGKTIKSCVTLAAACDGHEVWTIKALGKSDELAARLQKAFVECGAVQCGFCTPGMIAAGLGYLKNNGKADRKEIRKAISGNLCRCTGYVKIVDAIYKIAAELEKEAAV
jgi:carbon-monoxide dehydrogenase small subunit